MKTKRYVFATMAVITAWLGCNGAVAQGYYITGDTIRGNGFTYISEIPWAEEGEIIIAFPGDIRLRNIYNVFTGIGQKAGGVPLPYMDNPKVIDDDDRVFRKFHNIINSVLNSTDKNNAKNDILIVEVYINSTTGKIVDIEFNMNVVDGFAKIAPEKYYQIETMLKQQVTYQINSIGRRYNYNYDFWPYKGSFFGQTMN